MRPIETADAYQSSSPLSQAIDCDDYVFVSGSAGFDPETDELVSDDLVEQTEQTFRNIEIVLESVDLSLDDVVKFNTFLTDSDDFEAYNEVYAEALSEPYPARSTVVTDLVFDGKIEIDAIAKR